MTDQPTHPSPEPRGTSPRLQYSDRTRVFVEDPETGSLTPVPKLGAPDQPIATEVIAAMRSFVARADDEDLLLMTAGQARALVQRIDQAVDGTRRAIILLDDRGTRG